MCKMINQFIDKIKGQFSFFDRMIINGYIRPFQSEQMRSGTLPALGVLCKDYKQYFSDVTESIKSRIENSAAELNRPVIYLSSSSIRKEDKAKEILSANPDTDGLICVLKTLEACKTAKVYGNDDGKLVVKTVNTKCLHYYPYCQDREFGFMFVKIQTWFPFTFQVYINGRELMKHAFDENGISYQCYDNSFTDISDVAKAQELADKFDSAKLCRRLGAFAKSINPFFDTVMNTFGQGYFWCVNQCESANCTDVFTFMGRKPDPRFQGEAVSDYKKRPIGCRVKFKCKSNSIKMYNKCSVLRIETTINNPKEFKVLGTVHHNDGTESAAWKPMGKSISNLYRYAEVSKACNQRFLDSMVDIVPVKSTIAEIESVCSCKKVNGKKVTGFNVWAPDVIRITEAVSDGKYFVSGFRNKDISKLIFPDIRDAKKLSSKTSRTLKNLRRMDWSKKSQGQDGTM